MPKADKLSRWPMPLNAYGWNVLIGLYEKSIAMIIGKPTKTLWEIVVKELKVNELDIE